MKKKSSKRPANRNSNQQWRQRQDRYGRSGGGGHGGYGCAMEGGHGGDSERHSRDHEKGGRPAQQKRVAAMAEKKEDFAMDPEMSVSVGVVTSQDPTPAGFVDNAFGASCYFRTNPCMRRETEKYECAIISNANMYARFFATIP